MTRRSGFWASQDDARRDQLEERARSILSLPPRKHASPILVAVAAFLACPAYAIAATLSAAISLIAWPFAPVWAYAMQRRKIQRHKAQRANESQEATA